MYGGGGGGEGGGILFSSISFYFIGYDHSPKHTHTRNNKTHSKNTCQKYFLKIKAVLLWTVNWLEIPLKDLK